MKLNTCFLIKNDESLEKYNESWDKISNIINPLTTNVPHDIKTSKSIDWFLYDGEHWSLTG